MKEATYRRKLVKKLEAMFPGCVIIKLDPSQNQGIPDLLILFKNLWGLLEIKRATNAAKQPNQEYLVEVFNKMSFASFISPETEEKVLSDLQQSFRVSG